MIIRDTPELILHAFRLTGPGETPPLHTFSEIIARDRMREVGIMLVGAAIVWQLTQKKAFQWTMRPAIREAPGGGYDVSILVS